VFLFITSPFRGISASFKKFRDFMTEEPEDTPLPDVLTNTVTNLEGVLYHLDALRKHLLRAVGFFFLTTIGSFFLAPRVIDILASPVGGIHALTAIDVTEPIGVFMRVALLMGFALALPYIVFELWLFVAPGLSSRARMIGLLSMPAVLLFFLLGAGFAYFVMMPVALPFLMNFLDMGTQIRPASYITFVTGLLFWIGISFEFPLVIYILASIGLVKPKQLRDHWRIAVVVIAILAAVVTPTVDPINMSLVMGPLILLYFFSIGLAKIAYNRRKKE
jgi:sec-independent protein translocase protein TatC